MKIALNINLVPCQGYADYAKYALGVWQAQPRLAVTLAFAGDKYASLAIVGLEPCWFQPKPDACTDLQAVRQAWVFRQGEDFPARLVPRIVSVEPAVIGLELDDLPVRAGMFRACSVLLQYADDLDGANREYLYKLANDLEKVSAAKPPF